MRIKTNSRHTPTDPTITHKTTVQVSKVFGTYWMNTRRSSGKIKMTRSICSTFLRITKWEIAITIKEIQTARRNKNSRHFLHNSVKTCYHRTNQIVLHFMALRLRIRNRRCLRSLTKAQRSHSSSSRREYQSSSIRLSSSFSKNKWSIALS